MSLPPAEKYYTEEDVNHLVAREVAKQRMHDLERSLQNTNDQVVKMWAKFDASFDSLQKAIESQDGKIRTEIERDFATKLDIQRLENMYSTLTIRLSTIVATIMTCGLIINYFLTASKLAG